MVSTLMGMLSLSSSSELSNSSICKPAPNWRIEDQEPMAGALGNVTVVALLQASCGFCLVQAANMGPLRDKLLLLGLTDINYMIVNDQSLYSMLMFPELKLRAPKGIPVYEQTPGQPDVWNILDGDKDDFLIYDRCGRLTFHIRLPLSFLHFPHVEAAIRFTYNESICGNCSFDSNSTRITMNETSVLLSKTVNATQNMTKEDGVSGKETNHEIEKETDQEPHSDFGAHENQHLSASSFYPLEKKKRRPRQSIKSETNVEPGS
ncbi:hypothetical protein GDO86_007924 [Hymenochirus boettgeri]|uniref:Selenoprotein P N-terminal domain-containing protein n=1 Tax=Hymenochirus boettgeri TaxID=247094 RepID=A0A8T2IYI6_9PIPI|nr:hypothetical protein GDO86_007924 [Hymenochirus boettgeri]